MASLPSHDVHGLPKIGPKRIRSHKPCLRKIGSRQVGVVATNIPRQFMRAYDRGQWIPEFMSEHGQEFDPCAGLDSAERSDACHSCQPAEANCASVRTTRSSS